MLPFFFFKCLYYLAQQNTALFHEMCMLAVRIGCLLFGMKYMMKIRCGGEKKRSLSHNFRERFSFSTAPRLNEWQCPNAMGKRIGELFAFCFLVSLGLGMGSFPMFHRHWLFGKHALPMSTQTSKCPHISLHSIQNQATDHLVKIEVFIFRNLSSSW